jgi:Xaa-Pro aminopeptidase
MTNILISLAVVLILMIFDGLKGLEASLTFSALYIAFNTIDILKLLKKEQLTDEDNLRAIYDRDRLLAALKQMQESNPGVLTFAIKSAAEIKKARAAWVNASAVVAEVEKHNVK